MDSEDFKLSGVASEVVVTMGAGRHERDVEVAERCRQISHLALRQRLSVMGKVKALRLAGNSNPSLELIQRSGQLGEVLGARCRGDIHVGGHVRRAVDRCCKAADEYVADPVPLEDIQDCFGPELSVHRRHARRCRSVLVVQPRRSGQRSSAWSRALKGSR